MSNVFQIAVQFLAVLFAISVHESAHAWVADRFGDPTARRMGRVTLNPLPHIDLLGTIVFPLILAISGAPAFGWAKPVMVNPYNLRHPRRDNMFIAAAGPLANLLTAALGVGLFLLLRGATAINLRPLLIFFLYLVVINVYLAIFNLIPVPPLDGGGIVEGLLRGRALEVFEQVKPYGFLILLAIIFLGVLDVVAQPILRLVMGILGVG